MEEENKDLEQEENRDVLEESLDRIGVKEKEILLVRMDDRYTAEEVTQIIQNIGEKINGEDQEFTTPVLFVDKSVEFEKMSIERLEKILDHAKSISEEGRDAQEEVEPPEDEEGVEKAESEEKQSVDMDQIPEELEDLIPDNVDKEDL